MIVPAKGVQIYECRAKKDQAGTYEWAFVAPEAALFDTSGKKIGRHYAGPYWESTDGSKIAGTVKERTDSPRADAIPWLLLVAKSVGPQGSFSKITAIQRVNTIGGAAAESGCSQSAVGRTVRIPYTADYYFLTDERHWKAFHAHVWPSTWRSRQARRAFFFSSRRRHTRLQGDWSSDVCSSDLSEDRKYVSTPVEVASRCALAWIDTNRSARSLLAKVVRSRSSMK